MNKFNADSACVLMCLYGDGNDQGNFSIYLHKYVYSEGLSFPNEFDLNFACKHAN